MNTGRLRPSGGETKVVVGESSLSGARLAETDTGLFFYTTPVRLYQRVVDYCWEYQLGMFLKPVRVRLYQRVVDYCWFVHCIADHIEEPMLAILEEPVEIIFTEVTRVNGMSGEDFVQISR